MKYAYQYTGAPLLQWGMRPPYQSRAADTVALGSLGGSTLAGPTLVLPAPGAPEPVDITPGMGGCSCSGSCGCGPATGLSGFVDSIPGGYLTLGVGAFLAWRMLRKRRR
jgi:hypothetical protein